jgi:hypothetical protein
LRVKVYQTLDYKSTLALRVTNKKIKSEVDTHLKLSIKLDQTYRGFRKLCRHRIQSCKVVNLTYHNLPKGSLFKHPSKLKEISFDGNISLQNFLRIVAYCDQLKSVSFTHETLGQQPRLLSNGRVQQCLETNFRNLTTLSIQFLRYPLDNPLQPIRNVEVLLSLYMPQLKTFKLFFSLWGDWLPVLKFLERHVNSLKEIELHVGDRGDSRNTAYFYRSNHPSQLVDAIDESRLKTLTLRSFHFRDDVLNLNPFVKCIVLNILESQRKLEALEFHSPGDLTITNLRRIVVKNEATLTEVVIYNLKNFIEAPQVQANNAPQQGGLVMDASVFKNCKNLKTLALSCANFQPPRYGVIDLGSIKLIKIDDIPIGVERLHLNGFTLNEDELVRLSQRAGDMKEVLIVDAGSMKYSSVLNSLLRNCSKLEYLNVRPVATRASNEASWFSEVKELSNLYLHFMGVPFDPIDDLEGFEAKIGNEDRAWIQDNVQSLTNVTF